MTAHLPPPADAAVREPAILCSLRAALLPTPWAVADLQPLPDKGLAHLHVRLAGSGLLARIPKQSQLGLPPRENLRHQQACFERAAAGGHTPRLAAVLPVSQHLPRGALVVEEIAGEPVTLPTQLPAIARALASLHALPLPPLGGRAPLDSPADPLGALLAEIGTQAQHVAGAGLDPSVWRVIDHELAALHALASHPARPAVALISFDAHPGNFLLRAPGDAVLVDLEKCRYGYPGLDLAHATLYTSTTWDVATHAVLSADEAAGFYRAWEAAVGPALAVDAKPWHGPLRRAMWLWSLTWCCKWRVLSGAPPQAAPLGEDWSAAHSDAALVAHVRERVDHYLSPPVVERIVGDFAVLERALAG